MSTVASRLISGSIASWAVIAVTMISQLVLVPVYLAYWSIEVFGIWLAIQAIISVLSTVDFGYQTFLSYEFLRLGKTKTKAISQYLWSGIAICVIISLAQILAILLLLAFNAIPLLLGDLKTNDTTLYRSAGIVLTLQSITWLICNTIVGLVSKSLATFGYFPRTVWWGVVHAIVNALAPLTAVVLGADLLAAGIAAAIGQILLSVPTYYDLFRLLYKEKVFFIIPSLKLGYRNFVKSLAISAKSLLEMVRQQGVRLFIAPLSGVAGLAAFSTMRTGANVALQGLNTIINPIMPDLMTFLHQRDQPRTEAAFATIWIVVVAFIAPGVVILQTIVEPLYVFWTQGKIPFNPGLFAMLSMGVLVYAVIQPATAVVAGNNLLKPQLIVSVMAACIVISGLFALLPRIGILGGGISLLLAEIAASIAYFIYANRWMRQHSMVWPRRAFTTAVASVLIAAVSLTGLVLFPQIKWLITGMAALLFIWNLRRFWKVLPLFASQRARNIVANLPGVKKILIYYTR